MCGICGIIGNTEIKSTIRVKNMMLRMHHRGPDGKGLWQSDQKNVTLGHVRLAIQDPTDAGKQPMHHNAGLHYVINGEIYNYPELRKQLSISAEFDLNQAFWNKMDKIMSRESKMVNGRIRVSEFRD